jgi:hypothetical protein
MAGCGWAISGVLAFALPVSSVVSGAGVLGAGIIAYAVQRNC